MGSVSTLLVGSNENSRKLLVIFNSQFPEFYKSLSESSKAMLIFDGFLESHLEIKIKARNSHSQNC